MSHWINSNPKIVKLAPFRNPSREKKRYSTIKIEREALYVNMDERIFVVSLYLVRRVIQED